MRTIAGSSSKEYMRLCRPENGGIITLFSLSRRERGPRLRQENNESRPLPDLALRLDGPAIPVNDAVDDRKPMPVPWPGSLVVKNGSNMRSRTSGAIPFPVSLTVSFTYRPA
jgi:hypothetical protein